MNPSTGTSSRCSRRTRVLLWAWALCAAGPAIAAAPDPLLALVAERNALGDQVALSKWDSGRPVLDPAREAAVLDGVRGQAAAQGLDAAVAADFFAAQIEANKLVQYRLLQTWRARGHAPALPRPDLAALRARLDRLQEELLAALASTAALRARGDCAAVVSRRLDAYAAAHRLDALHRLALVRGLWDFCAAGR